MKDFLSFYAERYLKVAGLLADKQPIASLEALEKKSKKASLQWTASSNRRLRGHVIPF